MAATRRVRRPAEETERGFTQAVLDLARLTGWRAYHTHDSRRSPAGFPDLCMVRGERLLFAELKTARGRATLEQRHWMGALSATGVAVYLWRPVDWASIQEVLR